MSRAQICPGCTNRFTRGRAAHVFVGGEVKAATVCQECAAGGLLLVIPSAAAASRARNAPIAAHIRKLAKAYELNDDARAEGLRQAADVIESGRAVPIEEPRAPLGAATSTVPLAKLNGAAHPKTPAIHRDVKPDNGVLSKADRRILSAVAHASASRAKLAILTGYSARSGGFASALARLRKRGHLVSEGGEFAATHAGLEVLGPIDPLPTGPALISYWSERLNPCESAILQCVATAYPREVPRGEIGTRTGYSETSGGFASALAKLRTLELVDGFKASPALMEAAT